MLNRAPVDIKYAQSELLFKIPISRLRNCEVSYRCFPLCAVRIALLIKTNHCCCPPNRNAVVITTSKIEAHLILYRANKDNMTNILQKFKVE